MKHRYLILRQEIGIAESVIVTAETTEEINNSEKLRFAISKGVESWVKATAEGKLTYEYAGEDMNIGDLSEFADEIVQYSTGIKSLSFESIDRAKGWAYDTSLCPRIEQ